MLETGFPEPRLQFKHYNPDNPKAPLRVDFEFTAADGLTVAVEFDGMQKYVNPAMTNYDTVAAVVHKERQREQILLNDGIARIVRVNYREAAKRTPLAEKLLTAGIPLAFPASRTANL